MSVHGRGGYYISIKKVHKTSISLQSVFIAEYTDNRKLRCFSSLAGCRGGTGVPGVARVGGGAGSARSAGDISPWCRDSDWGRGAADTVGTKGSERSFLCNLLIRDIFFFLFL